MGGRVTVRFPIGPFHPALEEPERFIVTVSGEEVVHVEARIGYNHRGIEWLGERRHYLRNVELAERICGICSGTHTACYCQAVEDLIGLEPPDRARYLRVLMLELERIHSHMLWAGIAMYEMGFELHFMHLWAERENVMDMLEALTGNRVNYAYLTPGGVRRDLDEKTRRIINERLPRVKRFLQNFMEVVTSDPTIRARSEGVGVLTREKALELDVVGPTARASGVDFDVRRDDPYAAYKELSWNVVTRKEGDVMARILVRLEEILESISMVEQVLDALPGGPIISGEYTTPEPGAEAMGRTEAPRGELMHYLRSDGTDFPYRWKVRTPTLANVQSVPAILVGGTIAEIPVSLASIDPCFACCDRLTVVDARNGKVKVYSFDKLRRMWLKCYGRR